MIQRASPQHGCHMCWVLITSAVEDTEEHNVVTASVFLVQHGFSARVE